jgi:hypothetical protein
MSARARLLGVLLALSLATNGCVYTVAGATPPPIAPPAPPAFRPRVEHTVGDFAFTLEGGKMITSEYAGELLSKRLMKAWVERGYVSDAWYVDGGDFNGTADYQLTLTGSQYGDSSLIAQFLCGLTLFLLPYSVTQNYDVRYELAEVGSGRRVAASIQGDDEGWVQLFLLFALPVAERGQQETSNRMADHLYQQFRAQGLFEAPPAAASP